MPKDIVVDIVVPELGESISSALVAKWMKAVGDVVVADEPLVELETDKVALEVPAAVSGRLVEIIQSEGAEVGIREVLGRIQEGVGAKEGVKKAPAPVEALVASPVASPVTIASAESKSAPKSAPSARSLASQVGVDLEQVAGSGLGGAITRADIEKQRTAAGAASNARAGATGATGARVASSYKIPPPSARQGDERGEEVVAMTRLRQKIAERLKEAQNTAALLSTFNEVNMESVIALRKRHREAFERKHGAKLGFMSFFVRAAALALHEYPEVNAELNGTDIVYKNYCDLGIAVSAPQGLVVPVLRDAQNLNFARIEQKIAEFVTRARNGKLTIADLSGGTFTITNGGVFGSLLSTPIVNPPQSAILGMHSIQERPIASNGLVVIAPMMYLALSYDHGIIDGRGAVSFLTRLKNLIEQPECLMLDV